MADKVEHIIKTGLKHGSTYAVYITQTNTSGKVSPKSAPVYITVGDLLPPAVPDLSLDYSYGSSGFKKNAGAIEAGFEWTEPGDEDFRRYHWYLFTDIKSLPYMGPGLIYPKSITSDAIDTGTVLKGTTKGYLRGMVDNKKYYAGIQSEDLSGNLSDVFVIEFTAHDDSVPLAPPDAPTVIPGSWSLQVTVACPADPGIASVAFYRDGRDLTGTVPYMSGASATFTDTLTTAMGRRHCYTTSFIDYSGAESPRSPASDTVEASLISNGLLDMNMLNAVFKSWKLEDSMTIDEIKIALEKYAIDIRQNASDILHATTSINEVYNNYNILAKTITLMSSDIKWVKDHHEQLQTAITQNAQAIDLKATKIETTALFNEFIKGTTAQIELLSDRITNTVSELNKDGTACGFTAVAQTAQALSLKVDKGKVKAEINMSPEGVRIGGEHFDVTADTNFADNVAVKGILRAENVKIYNPDNTLAFGGSGDVWRQIPLLQTGGAPIVTWGGYPGGIDHAIANGYFDVPGPASRRCTLVVYVKARATQGHSLDLWYTTSSGGGSSVGQVYQFPGSDVSQVTVLAQQFDDVPPGRYIVAIHGISDAQWWADGYMYQLFM